MEGKYTARREDITDEVQDVKVYTALTEEDLEILEETHRMGDELNFKLEKTIKKMDDCLNVFYKEKSAENKEEMESKVYDIQKEFDKYRVDNIFDYILKRLDYILSVLENSFLHTNTNKGNNMENKQENKPENEYTHPILLEDFVNLKEPVFDSEANIRDKKAEKEIDKGIISRQPVTIYESPDLKKVHNDYKRENYTLHDVMDKLNKLTVFAESQAKEITELKQEVTGLRKENNGLKQEIIGLKQENNGLRQELARVNERLDASEGGNKTLIEENKKLIEENKILRNAQVPPLKIVNTHNKRPRYSEGDVSDAEFENVSLIDKDSESRQYNLLTGMRDTFSVFTPRGVLTQEKQENELRRAAYAGDINRVRAMVNRNRNIVNGRGMPDSLCSLARAFQDKTALMLAAQQGNLPCVKFLLENGAMVNLCDRDNFTALDYALRSFNKEVVDILREHHAVNGADVVNHIKNQRIEKEISSFHMVNNDSQPSHKLKHF